MLLPAVVQTPLLPHLHATSYLGVSPPLPSWPNGTLKVTLSVKVLAPIMVGAPGACSAASEDDCTQALAALPEPVARRRMR